MRHIIAWLCLLPVFYILGFFAYVSAANDPGCGSQEPGLCFGAGLLMTIMFPLAIITTIAALVLFFWPRKDTEKPPDAP